MWIVYACRGRACPARCLPANVRPPYRGERTKIKASCITTDAGGFCIYSNGFTALLVVCAVAEAIASGMAKAAV